MGWIGLDGRTLDPAMEKPPSGGFLLLAARRFDDHFSATFNMAGAVGNGAVGIALRGGAFAAARLLAGCCCDLAAVLAFGQSLQTSLGAGFSFRRRRRDDLHGTVVKTVRVDGGGFGRRTTKRIGAT